MLKLSGEALMGDKEFGIDLNTINAITNQIKYVFRKGIRLSIVVGGGNIFRGISGSSVGMDRSSADYTGMMATVINSLILQNSIEQKGIDTRVQSAIKIENVCESYIRRKAIRHIDKNRIVIFAAGTGNPASDRQRPRRSAGPGQGSLPARPPGRTQLCRNRRTPGRIQQLGEAVPDARQPPIPVCPGQLT